MIAAAVHSLGNDIETIFVYAVATLFGGFIIWLIRTITKMVKTQAVINEQVLGREETKQRTGLPSLQERFSKIDDQFVDIKGHLAKQDCQLEKVESEVKENGGASIKDAVKRIDKNSQENGSKLDKLASKLEEHIVQPIDIAHPKVTA